MRSLRQFTSPIRKRTEIVYTLKHECVKRAIEQILSTDDCQQYRLDILKYFRDFKAVNNFEEERQVQIEVPYQLQKLNKISELPAFFKTHKIGLKTHWFEKSKILKRLCCAKVVHKNAMTESQLFICVFCKNAFKGMGQSIQPNVQTCVICSGPVFGSSFTIEDAWYCTIHKSRSPPNWTSCFVCNKQLAPNMEKTPLKRCSSCFIYSNQCCYIPTKRI